MLHPSAQSLSLYTQNWPYLDTKILLFSKIVGESSAALAAAIWAVQDYTDFDPGAAYGIALREVLLKSSKCDYQLLVDRKLVAVITARRLETLISGASEQTAYYAANLTALLKIDCDQPVLSTNPPVSKLISTDS